MNAQWHEEHIKKSTNMARASRRVRRTANMQAREKSRAFSLLEMLVVLGIITLLASILLPNLAAAREQAKSVSCRSNLAQIVLANSYYADDSGGVYCPGAAGFMANLQRWHGARNHPSEVFDSSRGPLVPYLGPEGAVRQCPTFPADKIAESSGGFERGNGGYGYNNAYLGVQTVLRESGEADITTDLAGTVVDWVSRPAETVMFADTAFAANQLIEYSFAEPRYHPQWPTFRTDPSIHFRHSHQANVGWCDGHVDGRQRTLTYSSGIYPADPDRLNLGWFGKADDNRLFDLE